MLFRRSLLSALPIFSAGLALAARWGRAAEISAATGTNPGFSGFLAGIWAEARLSGVSPATLNRALSGLQPNPRVVELDRSQPEFTITWQRYRRTRVSPARIARGQAMFRRYREVLEAVQARYGVDPGVILAIWGLESDYGADSGGFSVVEALATLAFEGRRAAMFRRELIAALQIVDHGDVPLDEMLGSWAGAMGQPQFMPSVYQRYAVDFTGKGRRDIWNDTADVLASIANYLAQSGWQPGQPWGFEVRPPADDNAETLLGRSMEGSEWRRIGFTTPAGEPVPALSAPLRLLLPEGAAGQAFLVGPNFNAIRAYNPSDFYALAVGLLADRVAA